MADGRQITEAVILCGGKGTRLKSVVVDLPKPLAPIGGKPFLSILMKYLCGQGMKRIILATGYMHEAMESTYGKAFSGMEIAYSRELTTLGTGGAVAMALRKAESENVLVLNGDSIIKFSLAETAKRYFEIKNDFPDIPFPTLLTLKRMENVDRYGAVAFEDGRIKAFEEKAFRKRCFINAGVYILNKETFRDRAVGEVFSFEKDFLEREVKKGSLFGIESDGFFIDIGVPEDYALARDVLIQRLD